MSLSPHEEHIRQRVRDILVQKDAAGAYVYTKSEVRDFIVLCVLRLGVPVTPELMGAMRSFVEELGVPSSAPGDEVSAAVVSYFEANPLNASLLREFEALARGELLTKGQDFADAADKLQALEVVGADTTLKAPPATARKADTPKLKRGLSKS